MIHAIDSWVEEFFLFFNLRESSTSELTRSKLKYFIFYIKYYVIFSLSPSLPLSVSLPLSRSLSLSASRCMLVQTSRSDIRRLLTGFPSPPPRPPSTQNFNCQKIIMDTNRLGTIMSCKPTQKKLFVLFKLNI